MFTNFFYNSNNDIATNILKVEWFNLFIFLLSSFSSVTLLCQLGFKLGGLEKKQNYCQLDADQKKMQTNLSTIQVHNI